MNVNLTPTESNPNPYIEIFSNIYISRKKREPTENDIFECNCDPAKNTFCGVGCLNRMYSAECNINYCRVGDKCQNMRFQQNKWCDVSIKKAGKKGR
eukprot:227072_1